jgi:hypothetical protein
VKFASISRLVAVICLAGAVLCAWLIGFVIFAFGGGWVGYMIAPAIGVIGVWWLARDGDAEKRAGRKRDNP